MPLPRTCNKSESILERVKMFMSLFPPSNPKMHAKSIGIGPRWLPGWHCGYHLCLGTILAKKHDNSSKPSACNQYCRTYPLAVLISICFCKSSWLGRRRNVSTKEPLMATVKRFIASTAVDSPILQTRQLRPLPHRRPTYGKLQCISITTIILISPPNHVSRWTMDQKCKPSPQYARTTTSSC
jgi:hypothetical protein